MGRTMKKTFERVLCSAIAGGLLSVAAVSAQAQSIGVNSKGDAVFNLTGKAEELDLNGTGVAGEIEWFYTSGTTQKTGILIGVTRNVIVNTKGGNDGVFISGLVVSADLNVNTAGGQDDVLVEETFVGDDMRLTTGGGADVVYVGGVAATSLRSTAVDSDDDYVMSPISSVTVDGNMFVVTGGSDDDVGLFDLSVGGQLRMSTGSGSDFVEIGGEEILDLGAATASSVIGDDCDAPNTTTVLSTTSDDSRVIRDGCAIGAVVVGGPINLSLGSGDDLLGLAFLLAHGNLSIVTLSGEDLVALGGVAVYGRANINLGTSHDALLMLGSNFMSPSPDMFNGGAGTDGLFIVGTSFNQPPDIRRFEEEILPR